jgi:glyoxylase-like metal-dependent hydrolase (beta-lactamase superfamily II)
MTIDITGREQWQAWQDGVLPAVERVRDGVWSIPVPIPDNPLRYVLVYALECREGVALVDAGWNDDRSWRALVDGLSACGFAIGDVRAVMVTHFHADHLGLAGRVREASGAWVALHTLDARRRVRPADTGRIATWIRTHLVRNGAPSATARAIVRATPFEKFAQQPRADVLLEDDEIVRMSGLKLTVVWTPGHSPGHSCFYEPNRRLLFSGDHILPRITPHIAIYDQFEHNPLEVFLRSLDRLDRYEVDEVLPAHEYRFRGVSDRLADMARHHTRRLAELFDAVRRCPGSTAWKLCARLSWSRPWAEFDLMNRRFALGETLAHLAVLRSRGEVRATSGAGPVRWYPSTVDGMLPHLGRSVRRRG